MLIFKDKNTESEICSDVYNIIEIEGVIIEIEGKTVSRTIDASNVDIGANASQEEAADELESAKVQGPDFALDCRLKKVETPMKKKEYLLYMKTHYLKSLKLSKEKQAKVQAYLAKVLPKFSAFDQYFAEGDFVDAEDGKLPMVLLVNYRDDTDNPYMICFKDGLVEEKV